MYKRDDTDNQENNYVYGTTTPTMSLTSLSSSTTKKREKKKKKSQSRKRRRKDREHLRHSDSGRDIDSKNSEKSIAALSAVVGKISRIKYRTAKALGVSEDTDFNRLKQLQLRNADDLSGATKNDRATERILESLVNKANIDANPREKLNVTKDDVIQANEAFQRDLEEFEYELQERKKKKRKKENKKYNIQQVIDDGASVDDIALDMILAKPSKHVTSKPSAITYYEEEATPSERSAKRKKNNIDNFRNNYVMEMKEQRDRSIGRGSSETLYENFTNRRSISKSGLSMTRFSSTTRQGAKNQLWDTEAFISEKVEEGVLSQDQKRAKRNQKEGGGEEERRVEDMRQNVTRNPAYKTAEILSEGVSESNARSTTLERKKSRTKSKNRSMLTGQSALNHYQQFARLEKTVLHKVNGVDVKTLRERLLTQKYDIENALQTAKEYYSQSSKGKSMSKAVKKFKNISKVFAGLKRYKKSKDSAEGHQEEARVQLETIKTYKPWFIYVITALQAVGLFIILVVGGISSVGVVPSKRTADQETWNGKMEIESIELPNIWVGPEKRVLVRLGGIYAPCMRYDRILAVKLANYSRLNREEFGCCEITGMGAGTTTDEECYSLVQVPNYLWRNGTTCAERSKDSKIARTYEAHRFKPCCFGDKGDCQLLSHGHCEFLRGRWHMSGSEHCSQAGCDGDICNVIRPDFWNEVPEKDNGINDFHKEIHLLAEPMIKTYLTETDKDRSPLTYIQVWRLPISLLYHYGLLHYLLVAISQMILGAQVERLAGWLRVATIYLVSGLGGLLAGSTLSPLEPTVGGGGAVSGLIGVHIVELIQSWKLVQSPCKALTKLLGIFNLFIISGFLPQVNQFVQLTGFVLGILTAIVCLPYITFNSWHAKRRIILICFSLTLLLGLIFGSWIVFYQLQPSTIGILQYINCISYTEHFCDEEYITLDDIKSQFLDDP